MKSLFLVRVVSMEGGDGVVAIVRGCRHAGLAVTLLPRAYFKMNRRKCVDIGKGFKILGPKWLGLTNLQLFCVYLRRTYYSVTRYFR